jgi:hypothetical protein
MYEADYPDWKRCTTCHQWKTRDQYYPFPRGHKRLEPRCKTCKKLARKDRPNTGNKPAQNARKSVSKPATVVSTLAVTKAPLTGFQKALSVFVAILRHRHTVRVFEEYADGKITIYLSATVNADAAGRVRSALRWLEFMQSDVAQYRHKGFVNVGDVGGKTEGEVAA